MLSDLGVLPWLKTFGVHTDDLSIGTSPPSCPSRCRCYNTQQNAQGNPVCAWKEHCADACRRCTDCIAVMEHPTLSLSPNANPFIIAAAIQEACISTRASNKECRSLEIQAWPSRNATLKRRPAALCARIDYCTESSSVLQDKADVAIETFSPTGSISGASNVNVASLTPEQYNNKSDCLAAEWCSFTSVTSCRCDPKDGSNTYISVGECEDFCDQNADQNFQWPVGALSFDGRVRDWIHVRHRVCLEMQENGMFWGDRSPDSILRRNMCSTGADSEPATFDDRGDRILLDLNFPTPRKSFSCSAAFNKATVNLVVVYATSKEFTACLLEGAAISPGDEVTLSIDQGTLVDILETPFSGQTTVATCGSCEPPSTLTLYPKIISPGCGHLVGGVLFDSSCPMDPTRRWMAYNWTIDTDECYRIKTYEPFGADPSCLEVANTLQAHSTESLFELPTSTVSSLASRDYQLRLDILNNLSASSFPDAVFTRAATQVPIVGIFGEQKRAFEIKKGFKISTFVDKSSLCDNYTVDYLWVCTDDSPWGVIPEEGYTRKNLVVKGPVDAAPGQTNGVRSVAYLRRSNGFLQGQSSLDTHMTAIGSPLVAIVDSPTGDFVLKEDVCLNASASYDPDDPSALSELSASWKCELDELVKFGPRDEGSLIPTGRAMPVCGSVECLATLNPSEIINLMVTVDFFIVEKTSESSHNAGVSFLPNHKGFVDEDFEIVYEFWEAVGRSFVLFRRGPSTAYEIKGLSQGNIMLVVKATDASGGFAQQEETVMVLQPEGGISLDSVLHKVVLSADEGTRSGNTATVFQESTRGAQLLELAEETGGIAADDGKIIVRKFAEASIAQIPSESDVDPAEYIIAQGVLRKLPQSGWTEASVVEKMLNSIVTGPTAACYGARAFKGENYQDVLNIVSSASGKRIVGDDPKVEQSSVFCEKMKNTTSLCLKLSCSTLTLGVNPVTLTTSSTKVDPIVMQCSKNNIESLGGKPIAIQTTGSTIGRKLQSSEAQPSVKLHKEFHTKCEEFCPVETIGTSLQYLENSQVIDHIVVTDNSTDALNDAKMIISKHTPDIIPPKQEVEKYLVQSASLHPFPARLCFLFSVKPDDSRSEILRSLKK